MTYAAHSGISASGPTGTQEAAQRVGGESGIGRIPAGVYFDGFGPVYLTPMQSGAAAPRVCGDVSSPKLAADAPSVGGAFCSEWWEV